MVDYSFVTGGYGDQPLPEGTAADPTYLAFLRGMGMDQQTAWSTAIKHVAALKAQYQTAVTRDPEQLHDELRTSNANYSGGGNWWAGQRLTDDAEVRTHDQERLADLHSGLATGIAGEQDTLRGTLEQLARQNVDQVGALRQRTDEQHNQDAYIRAVAQANTPKPAAPGVPTPATAPAAAPAASQVPTPSGQHAAPGATPLAQQLAGLNPAQAAAFRLYTSRMPVPAKTAA